MIVIAGGVIPHNDYEFLYQNGCDFIFGPGTPIVESAVQILNKLLARK